MAMTPREVIKANVKFADPERIGFEFSEPRKCDTFYVAAHKAGWMERRWTEGRFEYYDDEWGNIWFRVSEMGAGGEIFKPAIEDWPQLASYRMPGFANPERFAPVRDAFAKAGNMYRMGGLPGFPFAICRYLRKMEIYFQDLILERKHIDELHGRVVVLLEEMMRQYASAGADGLFFCEDWGIQDRLLIHPDMWREIFKPLFTRLCGTAHDLGLDVFMHSCGYNWEIIPDLAAAGIDVLQFDQPHLYGLERLADRLQALKVCLDSPVDIQRILPTGNRDLIVEHANKMVRLFGGRHGGFIARNYGDLHGIGVDPQFDQWAYDAFVEAQNLPAV